VLVSLPPDPPRDQAHPRWAVSKERASMGLSTLAQALDPPPWTGPPRWA
jgi:hypothetical protein